MFCKDNGPLMGVKIYYFSWGWGGGLTSQNVEGGRSAIHHFMREQGSTTFDSIVVVLWPLFLVISGWHFSFLFEDLPRDVHRYTLYAITLKSKCYEGEHMVTLLMGKKE